MEDCVKFSRQQSRSVYHRKVSFVFGLMNSGLNWKRNEEEFWPFSKTKNFSELESMIRRRQDKGRNRDITWAGAGIIPNNSRARTK